MEHRGKLTGQTGPARGKVQQGNLPDASLEPSVILGDIPGPGLLFNRRPDHSGKKECGMPLLKAFVAVRTNVRSTSDLARPTELRNVQLAGGTPSSPASEEKDCRVAPGTKPVH